MSSKYVKFYYIKTARFCCDLWVLKYFTLWTFNYEIASHSSRLSLPNHIFSYSLYSQQMVLNGPLLKINFIYVFFIRFLCSTSLFGLVQHEATEFPTVTPTILSRMEAMMSAVPSFVRRRAVVARAPRPGLATRSVAQTANRPWKSLCLHARRSSPLFLLLPFLPVLISRQGIISLYSSRLPSFPISLSFSLFILYQRLRVWIFDPYLHKRVERVSCHPYTIPLRQSSNSTSNLEFVKLNS